jgi:hypothetical protein
MQATSRITTGMMKLALEALRTGSAARRQKQKQHIIKIQMMIRSLAFLFHFCLFALMVLFVKVKKQRTGRAARGFCGDRGVPAGARYHDCSSVCGARLLGGAYSRTLGGGDPACAAALGRSLGGVGRAGQQRNHQHRGRQQARCETKITGDDENGTGRRAGVRTPRLAPPTMPAAVCNEWRRRSASLSLARLHICRNTTPCSPPRRDRTNFSAA